MILFNIILSLHCVAAAFLQLLKVLLPQRNYKQLMADTNKYKYISTVNFKNSFEKKKVKIVSPIIKTSLFHFILNITDGYGALNSLLLLLH